MIVFEVYQKLVIMHKEINTVAILDMYNGATNEGMRALKTIISELEIPFAFKVYDTRGSGELPDLDEYDYFVSTGGPGHPIEEGSEWQKNYFEFLDRIMENNEDEEKRKKYVFLICHSFQMACHHFELGTISKRKTRSFGLFPVHLTEDGEQDPIFKNVDNPMWVADSRDYQVMRENIRVFRKHHAKILSLENLRNQIEVERAIMAVRFSDEIVGTQFHPEADPEGFLHILQRKEVREETIKLRGKAKYYQMLENILDENKVLKTYNSVLPNFFRNAYNALHRDNANMNYA